MDNKVLPKKESFIKTYPKDANALSMLLQYDETYDWLLNCFIQLTSYDNTYLDYYDFNYRNCPLLEIQRINKIIVLEKYDSYNDFIINAINKNYYVYLAINTSYIKNYKGGTKGPHDLFVYGYNGKDRTFYISDNFKYGKYSNEMCSFEELDNATRNLSEEESGYQGFNNNIELISYRKESRAKLEIYRIKLSIEDYLESKPTSGWYVNHAMWDEEETRKRTFGIACYNTIDNHISIAKQLNSFGQGAIQAYYLMMEHKKTMIMRLKYLYDRKLFKNEEYILEYTELQEQALIALSLVMKYNVKPENEILNRIRLQYNRIKDMEESILYKILKYL